MNKSVYPSKMEQKMNLVYTKLYAFRPKTIKNLKSMKHR